MKYDELVKLSPYPVRTVFSCGRFYASFVWGNGFGRPYAEPYDPSIELRNDLCKAKRDAVLVHEIGHAMHYKKRCKCFTEPDQIKRRYLSELHAYRFALRFLMKHNMLKELQHEYEHIRNNLSGIEPYNSVAKKIVTERIWKKTKKTLGIE